MWSCDYSKNAKDPFPQVSYAITWAGFGWGRVNLIQSSQYAAVSDFATNSVDNTGMF